MKACEICVNSTIADWDWDEKNKKSIPHYWCEKHKRCCEDIYACDDFDAGDNGIYADSDRLPLCRVRDDAISRQAVLDATVKKNSVWNKITNAKGENLEQIILQLSPVNPQETVAEFADKCRECGARYGRLLKRFWYTGYKGLKNWTPISEGLPKEGKTVIASTKYGVYPEARYTKEYGWEWAYEAGADYWRELDDVEAWMPLPERYKPKEEQDERKTES